jgi:hypothetical protein
MMITRSIIIYDFITWHTSHERSNNVVIATKKLIELQQQIYVWSASAKPKTTDEVKFDHCDYWYHFDAFVFNW